MAPPLGRGLDALLSPIKTKIQTHEPLTSPIGAPVALPTPLPTSTAIPVMPYKPPALTEMPLVTAPESVAAIPMRPAAPTGAPPATYYNNESASHGMEEGQLLLVPLNKIKLNPFQPRRDFEPVAMAQLASSIRQHGLIQPIVVIQEGDHYILVAGERRFRACQMLGLVDVPAILKEADPNQRIVLSLVENLQRKDLNTIERAEAYKKLVDMLGLTHGEIGDKLGVSQGVFTNTMRFLKLPQKAQEALKSGAVAEGQMLTLMSVGDQDKMMELLDKILNEGISTNDLREEVSRYRLSTTRGLATRTSVSLQAEDVVNVRALEEKLGIRASVKRARNKAITISLTCHDENQYRELAEKLRNLS
ncbi:MAG: ParB-like protein partition protein [Parcubacteria group bacterium GW2011_GWA2_39_18]|nr:MAG: ParB-like protein partition protein [Parcubacteria group bacterium GW2011_GWA2_39_18]